MMSGPKPEYKTIIDDSGGSYVNRLLVGTAVTGLVRVEWVQARIGQVIPCNWSWVMMYEYLNGYMPLRYQVDDAQNLIVKYAIEKDFEWLLLYEHDVLPPPDALIKLNRWLTEAKAPVVSGLYYTRSYPSEPLIYRGRGTGAYRDFYAGDEVYCDGVPTGFLLVHMGLMREMWKDAPEYTIKGQVTRRVFRTPRDLWSDPEQTAWNTVAGTSDLEWCTRVMDGGYLERAGWGDYVNSLPDKRYPFIVDTNIFCRHINMDGGQFPLPGEEPRKRPPEPAPLGVSVSDTAGIGDSMV